MSATTKGHLPSTKENSGTTMRLSPCAGTIMNSSAHTIPATWLGATLCPRHCGAAVLRYRLQGADLQPALLPELWQLRPQAGEIKKLRSGIARQTDLGQLGCARIPNQGGEPDRDGASWQQLRGPNVDTALIKGLEAEASTALAGWNTRASLTLLDPRDTGRDKLLTRRAKRSLKLDADRPYGKWRVGGSLLVQGHRYDDVNNVNRVGGYGLLSCVHNTTCRNNGSSAPTWTMPSTRTTKQPAPTNRRDGRCSFRWATGHPEPAMNGAADMRHHRLRAFVLASVIAHGIALIGWTASTAVRRTDANRSVREPGHG